MLYIHVAAATDIPIWRAMFLVSFTIDDFVILNYAVFFGISCHIKRIIKFQTEMIQVFS